MFHKRVTRIPSFLPSWDWGWRDHHMATDWYHWRAGWGEEAYECVAPTVEEFRLHFTEFAEVSDQMILAAINEASCFADGTWIYNGYCQNCKIAIGLLAAHFLASRIIFAAGLPATAESPDGGGMVIAGGQVTRLHFESMDVSFSTPQFAGGGGGGGTGPGGYCDLCATPYGARYAELLKVNQPAVALV